VRPDLEERWARRVMHPRRGADVLVRELFMPALRQSYDDLLEAVRGADLLVSHPVTYAAPLVAEVTGVRWASSVLAPLSLASLARPGADPPLVAQDAAWLRRWPAAYRLLLRAGHRVTRPWTRAVAALRAELGLPPGAHPLFEGQHAPGLVLALFSPLLAPPPGDRPPNTVVTGSVFDDLVHDASHGAPAPALEAFLADGPPPVVVTLGTSAVHAGRAPRVYRESVRAAERLGRRLVLLTGADAAGARNRPPGPLPPWALAVPAASHARLFPRAAAVVHQGGMGTLAQALRGGRPMLVVPFAHDQPDNAERARRAAGAAVCPPRRYRAGRVARALGALLQDPAAARAARVGERVRAEDGARAAADALERFAVGAPAVG
jgi:UDP:flavonoid glycosyltransferase YjiC (YdhE family)